MLPSYTVENETTKKTGTNCAELGKDRKVLDGAVPHGADEKNKKYKKVLTP